jgi:rhodanese-related sulfurtransferase
MTISANGQIQTVNAETLKQLIDQNLVQLIDVREPSEFAGEHIAGATLLPLSSFDANKVSRQTSPQVILYCQSSNRSGQAAKKLLEAGFDKVVHLEGGINAWKQAGYPTKVNKNAPISIMRQVQIVAGSLVLTGTILGSIYPKWLFLSGFVGAGLVFSGTTNTCMMAKLLGKLPYNQ